VILKDGENKRGEAVADEVHILKAAQALGAFASVGYVGLPT
jgi:hypothetical protein